jgi:ketosteroid isomerase-like protein
LLTASLIILLIIGGGYLLWQKSSPSMEPTSKAVVTSPAPPPSLQSPSPGTEYQEVEKIKSLFENIKQANLKKNIDLFMSCYSRDFSDREGKRLEVLETWGFYNYHDLSFDLKKQTIAGDTANVRLEWLIRISKKAGGQPEDRRTLMDVTLKREAGHWKIKEIKPVS